jgi:Neuraminidase (sialidase)
LYKFIGYLIQFVKRIHIMKQLIRYTLALALTTSLMLTVGNVLAATNSAPLQVVDVSNDQTSQNETPLAVNPLNANNLITGANDWNYNDGCAVNATFDGGKTWTPTLPNGFLPGVTKYTNDPNIAGTGAYDAGGDPAVAFGPDGTAYFVCQAFNFTPPYAITLLISRSTDGGRTWLNGADQKLTQVSIWNGNGKSKGSNGQFTDHESIYIDKNPASSFYGNIYVTWVQFDGNTHSPVNIAVSKDGARTFSTPVQVTAGNIRNNQDARLTSAPDGTLYLTFDNGVQGGKGTVIYASMSKDGGATWTNPSLVAALNNPVCTFPPYCFNISGGAFRSGGSYPTPAFDAVHNRLDVIYPDIVGPYAQIYFTSAPADLSSWTTPTAIAPANGDRFQNEMSISSTGRLDVSFYDRSYTQNKLVDLTYASSTDGGLTWKSRRITSAGFDPSLWGVPSGTGFRPFIGDYNGMVSFADGAAFTWTGIGSTGAPFNLEIDYASAKP